KSAQIREILISESAWEEMTCLFAPSLGRGVTAKVTVNNQALQTNRVSTGKTNNLNVTVTLNGTPTSTGPIGGTGILAVNYL
ncbi:hypothetical protein VBQ99_24800, partial [Klebsiella pneumoniae]|nr:hypothetical protein [Klebsiella pneumoniae]